MDLAARLFDDTLHAHYGTLGDDEQRRCTRGCGEHTTERDANSAGECASCQATQRALDEAAAERAERATETYAVYAIGHCGTEIAGRAVRGWTNALGVVAELDRAGHRTIMVTNAGRCDVDSDGLSDEQHEDLAAPVARPAVVRALRVARAIAAERASAIASMRGTAEEMARHAEASHALCGTWPRELRTAIVYAGDDAALLTERDGLRGAA